MAIAPVIALALVGGSAAAVPAAGSGEITYHGTLMVLTVDPPAGATEAGDDPTPGVRIGQDLVSLPDGMELSGRTGDPVTVTVRTDVPMTAADALDVVAVPEPTDAARVVAVAPDAVGADVLATAEPTVTGAHTLTVLPVYTSATDGRTAAQLQAVAVAAAQYWSAQSNGRISIAPTTRDWQQVSEPAGACDVNTLFSEGLAANGDPVVDDHHHVLIYFPEDPNCSWAGLASIGGGAILVNGAPLVDVFSHEFGHNLGLGHAKTATCLSGGGRVPLAYPITGCTVSEYGDYADVMGIATTLASGNLNTAFADVLGLATVTHLGSGSTATVDLAPLGTVTALRAVAIPVTGGTVYVDFRPAQSPDIRVPAWAGVQVHYLATEPGKSYPVTYLLDMQPDTGGFPNTSGPAGSAVAMRVGGSWMIPGTAETVSVVAVGTTARIQVESSSSRIQRYVTRVYSDLFHRGVDPSGLATWTKALESGTPRIAVANSITGSDEYRRGLIRAAYVQYLGRTADQGGLDFWLGQLRGGRTITDLEAGFIASNEYYLQSGSTDSGWVTRLYRDVLGRGASAGEVAFWVQRARLVGRPSVARGFLLSTEHLTSVIDAYYQDLLGRGIDPSGRATWVGKIQSGVRLEVVIGSIIASDEYFAKS